MALIYFKNQVLRIKDNAYDRGFIDGVKFQKLRAPKPREIKVKHVD